jgi:hypothetical protein
LTGQGAKESSGLGWLDVVYEADREATKAAWLHAVQTKTRYAAKYRLKCRDGKLRWVLAHCVPIFDSVGDLEQWLGTLMDVDDLEQPVGPISEFSDLSALTGRAITAARALLNWSLFDLATQSGVSISSIRRIETLESLSVKKDVVLKLLSVLQYAGIEFRQDHGGWYVRARR